MKRTTQAALGIAILATVGTAAAREMSVFPPEPVAGQDFVVHVAGTYCGDHPLHGYADASVTGDTITVSYSASASGACTSGGQPTLFTGAAVRVNAPGQYKVVVRPSVWDAYAAGSVTVKEASPVTRTGTSLAGLWYVPAQPGWGLNITEGDSGQLFLTWYQFGGADATGSSLTTSSSWTFVSGGTWLAPNTFSGALYRAVGMSLRLPIAYDPARVERSPLGVANVTLTSPETLTFTVDWADYGFSNVYGYGRRQDTYNLTRYRF